jgi:hypothetical protein
MKRPEKDASDSKAYSKLTGNSTATGLLSPLLRISLILGVCVHLLGFLFFRVVSGPLSERLDREAFVQFVSPARLGLSEALEEQAALMDTAPLFIPGRWNAAHNLRAPTRSLALQRFPFYWPEIDLLAQLRPERSPIGETSAVEAPADLLALRYWDLFSGFGERRSEIRELEATDSFAEIQSINGRVYRIKPVAFGSGPRGQPDPVTFLLRIEAGGRVVGSPSLENSSQNEAFDAAAGNWLEEAGNTADLPAGLYRIRIYP